MATTQNESAVKNPRIRKALLVHSGSLGDFVMALRIVAALRQAGAEHVTVLGRPSIASVALDGGGVDLVLDTETGGFHALYHATAPLADSIRDQIGGHDLTLTMTAPEKAKALAQRLAEATGGIVINLDPRPRENWTGHVSDQWLENLQNTGIECGTPFPRIAVKRDNISRARQESALAADEPFVLLHPGSGGRAKCWPIENWLRLSQELHQLHFHVALLLGPIEEELWPEEIISRLASAGKIIRGKTVPELAALLAASHMFVGNDSGVSHLSAAVGTPTLAIFGPTDPTLWRPLGPSAHTLGGNGAWPKFDKILAYIRTASTEPRVSASDQKQT